MFKKISFLSIICFLVFSACLSAQVRYGVYAKGGVSDFIERNFEKSVKFGNSYSSLPSYNFGVDVIFPFSKSDSSVFQFISGIDFGSFAAKNSMSESFSAPGYDGPYSWNERLYSLSIPAKVNFKFERWVHVYGGFVYTFNLNKPEEMWNKKFNKSTLSVTGGVDFFILNRFVVGASYYRNVTPLMKILKKPHELKTETFKCSYYVQQICLKIGYIF